MKYVPVYTLLLLFGVCTSCKGEGKTDLPKDNANSVTEIVTREPNIVPRNILQDIKGNIWMPTENGVFRYNGKSVINITSKLSSARFISVLEDRKGILWFGALGSGVFLYNGKSPFETLQQKRDLLVMISFVFMKIKPATFGLVLLGELAVTMGNPFEIL